MDRRVTFLAAAVLVLALAPGAAAQDAPGTDTGPDAWTAAILPQLSGDASVVGVAVGPASMVAVGQRACAPGRAEVWRCWGQAWTSLDGIEWTAVDARASGLGLGLSRPVLSGPEVGLAGVAYGPAGFLAFGRVGEKGGQQSAVWRSDDGTIWERVTAGDTFPAAARLHTILGAEDGYLLGGAVYYDNAPRAAVWSSADGATWTRARGSEVFEVGGYIDTMEDPASGGINAFALHPGPSDANDRLADGVVAVGLASMPSFDRDPWAWSGACWGQLWRSPDGLAWAKDESGMPRPQGAIRSVAAIGQRLLVDAPICFDTCGSAVLLSEGGADWQVAYGSPVGGELRAMTSQGGRFVALLSVPETGGHGDTLALWTSDEGTDWTLDPAQPTLPAGGMWFHDVDMAVAGDRLVVTASGDSTGEDGSSSSVVLLSPPLP
jgi:hypothetical protein